MLQKCMTSSWLRRILIVNGPEYGACVGHLRSQGRPTSLVLAGWKPRMPEEDRHKQLVMLPMPADRDLLQIKKKSKL